MSTPLEAIDFLDLVHEIPLEFADAADFEDLLGNHEAVGELLTFQHHIAFLDDQVFCQRDEVFLFHAGLFVADNDNALVLLYAAEVDNTVDFRNLSCIFRTASFKELGHTRKTARDVLCLDRAARQTS